MSRLPQALSDDHAVPVAFPGDGHGRLLAGPDEGRGAETLAAHLGRLGPLPETGAAGLLAEFEAAGLTGRGGGGFPFAGKVTAVCEAAVGDRRPLVVVNASEGEPLSRKDQSLLELRPHLVLDGAALAARAVGADDVVVRLHERGSDHAQRLAAAITQRWALDDPTWQLSSGPDQYVAGEASAIVRSLEGGPALPRSAGVPLARAGLDGRPTLLSNVETYAHLALIARSGAAHWRRSGATRWSGPGLFTVLTHTGRPGVVVEVVGPVTVAGLIEAAGCARAYEAVLVGGLAGTWLPGARAEQLLADRATMRAAGAPAGCGLLAPLPRQACGIAETARLVCWLAGQSAAQCGPCVLGLDALSGMLRDLALGRHRRDPAERLHALGEEVRGRGACRLPDGAVALVKSAVEVFGDDLREHARGRPCARAGATSAYGLGPEVRP